MRLLYYLLSTMGLLDRLFRPPADEVARLRDELHGLMTKVARLEALTEGLDLKWLQYRDEFRRLIQRLEKRDQRAEKRADPEGGDDVVQDPRQLDLISAGVRARRNKRAV